MSDPFDFEIYFFGLICIHGGDPNRGAARKKKVNAILLEDPDHTPLIYLNGRDTEYELAPRSEVRFSNVADGDSSVLESFDLLVPHLEDLTRHPAKLKLQTYGVTVKLPAGRFAAAAHYDWKGEYRLDNLKIPRGTDCIARLTMLNVKTFIPDVHARFKDVSGNEQDVVVPSNGFILIANSELHIDDGARGPAGATLRPGFKKYAKATDQNEQYLADLYELDEACTTKIVNPPDIKAVHLAEALSIAGRFPVFNHPECSNTNWP